MITNSSKKKNIIALTILLSFLAGLSIITMQDCEFRHLEMQHDKYFCKLLNASTLACTFSNY